MAIGLGAAEKANHMLFAAQYSSIFKGPKTRLCVNAVRIVVGNIGDVGSHKRLQK